VRRWLFAEQELLLKTELGIAAPEKTVCDNLPPDPFAWGELPKMHLRALRGIASGLPVMESRNDEIPF